MPPIQNAHAPLPLTPPPPPLSLFISYRQSISCPGLTGEDWNHLVNLLHGYSLENNLKNPISVMFDAVLMSDDRHAMVDPLYMVENPYDRIGDIPSMSMGRPSIFQGSKSQSSSMCSSPADSDVFQHHHLSGLRRPRLKSSQSTSSSASDWKSLSPECSRSSSEGKQERRSRMQSNNSNISNASTSSLSEWKALPPDAPKLGTESSSSTIDDELPAFQLFDYEEENDNTPLYLQSVPRIYRTSNNMKDSARQMTSEMLKSDAYNAVLEVIQHDPSSQSHTFALNRSPMVTEVGSYVASSSFDSTDIYKSDEPSSRRSSYGNLTAWWNNDTEASLIDLGTQRARPQSPAR